MGDQVTFIVSQSKFSPLPNLHPTSPQPPFPLTRRKPQLITGPLVRSNGLK